MFRDTRKQARGQWRELPLILSTNGAKSSWLISFSSISLAFFFFLLSLFFFLLPFFFNPLSGFSFSGLKLFAEAANVGVFSYLVLQFACFGGLLCGLVVFSVPAFLSFLVFSGLAFLVLAFLVLPGFRQPFTLDSFTLPRGLRGSFTFLFDVVLVASLLFLATFLSGFFTVLGLLVLA